MYTYSICCIRTHRNKIYKCEPTFLHLLSMKSCFIRNGQWQIIIMNPWYDNTLCILTWNVSPILLLVNKVRNSIHWLTCTEIDDSWPCDLQWLHWLIFKGMLICAVLEANRQTLKSLENQTLKHHTNDIEMGSTGSCIKDRNRVYSLCFLSFGVKRFWARNLGFVTACADLWNGSWTMAKIKHVVWQHPPREK
jgi:hypothetical protein